jgi:hypothetical protein
MIGVSDYLDRANMQAHCIPVDPSLEHPGVEELFPGFADGDLALITGSSASIVSLLCVRAQLPPQPGD